MPEKQTSWTRWEQCEGRQGAEALSRLVDALPEFFANSTLVGSRWSRLPFYTAHRLMELQFARDHGTERAFVLHGPKYTWWLNGESSPMHDANDAESLVLTDSTVGDYVRFFLHFLRGEDGAFVPIESADEVGPRTDADVPGEDREEVLTLEAARGKANPLRMQGLDEEGRWLIDAVVAYDGTLFGTSLSVTPDGEVEMPDDLPLGTLDGLVVPEAPALSLELKDTTGVAPAGGVLVTTAERLAEPDPDADESFVGRANEQDQFRRVLELAGGTPGVLDEGHMILLHGLGGIGKTTLLKRLHESVGRPQRSTPLIAGFFNCEDQRHRGDYEQLDGPPIWLLLDQLYSAIRAGAVNRQQRTHVEKAFAEFRQAMAAQPELLRRASELGVKARFGRRSLSADQISTVLEALAASTGAPHAAALARPVGAVVKAVGESRGGRVKTRDYDALLAADLERLVGQFGDALKALSRHDGPVVLFVDTAEVLGPALEWLRKASRRSGSKVVWVLGLRLEAESDTALDSEAVRFRRSIHHTRLWSMPLTRFDDRTIEVFLRNRLGAGYPAVLDIEAVARTTHGIPLAVSLVSQLLSDGQSPAEALAPFRDGEASSVVRHLAAQFLVHTEKSSALKQDTGLLYGLALLYGDTSRPGFPGTPSGRPRLDPEALAALWDVPAQTVATRLEELAGRHDFVLSGSRRLHQEVRETFLLFLLDSLRRPDVCDMNTRAAALYRARAERAGHLTVDEQIADPDWQTATIALLWHTFWIEPGQGLRILKGLFATAVVTDSVFASALLQTAAFFLPACSPAQQRLISSLQTVSDLRFASRPSREGAAGSVRDVIKALKDSPTEPLLAATPPADVYYGLLRAGCHEALGLAADDRAALLLRAAGQVEPDGATAYAIASQVRELATYGYLDAPPDARQEILAALRVLIRFDPDDSAHNLLGNALFELGRHTEAEAAYREAIRLDPAADVYHGNLGATLIELKRYAEAEAVYREAIRLDPSDAVYQACLGGALLYLGRDVEAEAAYRDALRLDPGTIDAHLGLGYALDVLGRYAEAEAAYREAARLDPENGECQNGLGYALADLGRYAEAEAVYHEAIRLSPEFPNAHNGLGRLYLKLLGRTDEAEPALREALRLDPEYTGAYANLGSLHVITGDLDAARSSFWQATQSGPTQHPFSELMLGALDHGTDPAAAEEHFRAALTALDGPFQPSALTPFARAEIQALAMTALGRGEEAATVLRGAVSRRSGADVFQRQHYEIFGVSGLATEVTALIEIWRDLVAADPTAAGPWGLTAPR